MKKLNGIDDILALTPLQQGMLFHTLYAPESSVYNLQMEFALDGDLDEGALERAWQLMVQRHAALRTSFVWERVEKPYQVVHDHAHLKIARHDWRALSAAEQDERRRSCLEEIRAHLFDLTRPPLMRLTLIVLSEHKFRLVWTFHHIILEGWSAAIILSELWKCYGDLRAHRSPDLPAVRPFAEFIRWLQRKDQSHAEAYWRKRLKGFGAATRLAIDRSNGSAPAEVKRSDFCRLPLSESFAEAMKGLARTHRVTLNTVVQGAWSILLSRYSGEQDVVFGAVLSGRPPDIPGVESIVGLFVNTLPARMNVDGDAALIPWLQALQLDQATMRQYEYSSLMQVRAWSDVPGGQPLFHTALAFQNYLGDFPSGRVTPDLQVKELETLETSDQPLTLQVVTGDTLTLNLVYDIERFDRAAIERMLTHCRVLLEGMAAHPQARLKDLPILTDAERQRLLVDWNDTAAPYPTREVCLHQLIDEQAGRTPDQIAVVFEQQALTYGELNRRANQLAHHLQALGVEPDVLVGLFVERSLEMLVGIVGILKAGGAYVPIDPDYPKARIGYLLEDSKASIVLTQEALVDKLPSFAGQSICLDGDWADIGCESGENPVTQVKPENLAYVLFTSGSTGRPKGVALEHRAAVTFVQWAKQVFTPRELAAVLFSTSVCFDLSVFEMFVTLSAGGKIVLAKNAVHLPSLPEKDEVTLINTVPSAIAELLRMGAVPASVKTVNLAGEALSDRLVEQIYATTHVEKVYNLYGPTEATTYSTYALVRRGCPVTIGRPVAGTQCYILDTHRNPVPIGVVGELYLGGGGLARGYYARPELTDERFVPNPFSEERGGRMYRTGDLCRWLTDGNIEYLGRGDHQVKLRGFRIELGEIEAVIAQHPAVREVAVIAREDAPGDKRLVAYLVAESPPADLGARLRSLARTAMPEYMVPAHFVRLAALPRTHNGKLDRKALPAPSLTDGEGRGVAVAPRTPTEEMVAGVFRGVLDRTDFGVFDNFFDLGGHSLMAARIVLQLRVASGRDLPLRVLFERQTVSEVAEAIDALAWLASSGQEPAAAGNRVEIEL